MIPKIIHYCWFGGNQLSDLAIRCIESWKKYCPDYEIKEWNEENYDLDSCEYVREAYEAKKWAFVSDYVRFDILYRYGGLYFDTDVELLRPVEDLVMRGSFMGCEVAYVIDEQGQKTESNAINPGLGLAAVPGLPSYKEILNFYQNSHFLMENGEMNYQTIVSIATSVFKEYGFRQTNAIQQLADIYIYPCEYFGAKNYYTGEMIVTENTRAIHHYAASWRSGVERKITSVDRYFSSCGLIGKGIGKCVVMPLKVAQKIEREGVLATLLIGEKKMFSLVRRTFYSIKQCFMRSGGGTGR